MVNVSNGDPSLQSIGEAPEGPEDVSLNLLSDVLLVVDSNSRKLGGCSVELGGRKLCLIEDIKLEEGPYKNVDGIIEKSLIIP